MKRAIFIAMVAAAWFLVPLPLNMNPVENRPPPDSDPIPHWWAKTFHGNGDESNPIIAVSDESIYIAGTTTSFGAGDKDIWLIEVSFNGTILREKTFGGNNVDEIVALFIKNHILYIVGKTHSFTAYGCICVWFLKYNLSNDNVCLQKVYRYGFGDDILPTSAFLQNDDLYVSGIALREGYITQWFLMKINALTGNIIWIKLSSRECVPMAPSNLFATNDYVLFVYNYSIFKFDADGNFCYYKYADLNYFRPQKIITTSQHMFLAGTCLHGDYLVPAVIKKYLNDTPVWAKAIDVSVNVNAPIFFDVSEDLCFIAVCTDTNPAEIVLWAVSQKTGEVFWQRRIGGISDILPSCIRVSKIGVLLAATAFPFRITQSDLWILKMSTGAKIMFNDSAVHIYEETPYPLEINDYFVYEGWEFFGRGWGRWDADGIMTNTICESDTQAYSENYMPEAYISEIKETILFWESYDFDGDSLSVFIKFLQNDTVIKQLSNLTANGSIYIHDLPRGNYTIKISAHDGVDEGLYEIIDFELMNTPPQIVEYSCILVNNNCSLLVEWAVYDPDFDEIEITIKVYVAQQNVYFESAHENGSTLIDVSRFPRRNATVNITAHDPFNTRTSVSQEIYIPNSAPIINIQRVVQNTSLLFIWNASDPNNDSVSVGIKVYKEGNLWQEWRNLGTSFSWNLNFAEFSAGKYIIQIIASDFFDSTTYTYEFIKRTPSVNITTNVLYNPLEIQYSCNSDYDGILVYITVLQNNSEIAAYISDVPKGSWVIDLPPGKYVLIIRVVAGVFVEEKVYELLVVSPSPETPTTSNYFYLMVVLVICAGIAAAGTAHILRRSHKKPS